MPISYALFENHVTSDPNDYAGIVQVSGSADGVGGGTRRISAD